MVLLVGATVAAQRAPQNRAEVARPGGKIAGAPPLALVKIADGFNDPTNVTSAGDGSGRLFVVERVGRVKIVDRDGKVLPLSTGRASWQVVQAVLTICSPRSGVDVSWLRAAADTTNPVNTTAAMRRSWSMKIIWDRARNPDLTPVSAWQDP